jgi:hypothetical protein
VCIADSRAATCSGWIWQHNPRQGRKNRASYNIHYLHLETRAKASSFEKRIKLSFSGSVYSSADGTWKGGMYASVFICEVGGTGYSARNTVQRPATLNREEQIWYVQCSTSHRFSMIWAPNGTRLSARCHFTGPKKLSISRAQPPPTCPSNGYAVMHASKHYAQGCLNHRSLGGFLHKSPRWRFQGPYWGGGGWRSRCIMELNRPARAAQVHNRN